MFAVVYVVGKIAAKYSPVPSNFYGPTTDEINYYEQDEKGRRLIEEWHEDYRKLL